MTVGRTPLILLLLGSGGLLLGALGFQYLEGMEPCPLCFTQRWPHIAVVTLAYLGLTLLPEHRAPVMLLPCALLLATTAGVGVYHAGIEYGWWAGPGACSGAAGFDPSKVTADSLMDSIGAAPPARCDAVPWSLYGISMAGWNALLSAGLAAFATVAGLREVGIGAR